MIPALIVVGLAVGLLPKPWYLVGLGAAAVVWLLLFVDSGAVELGDPGDAPGVLAIAVANTGAGVVVVRKLAGLVRALS